MPLPLVPLAAVGVAGIVTLALRLAKPTLPNKLAGKRVAILGGPQVGKTTLLRYLEFDGLLEGHTQDTVYASNGGTFEMDMGGAAARFDVLKDVPGIQDLQYKDWHEVVEGADYVWYLFRADLLTDGEPAHTELVRKHLTLLRSWLDSMKTDRPKVILIGTHSDQSHDSGSSSLLRRVQNVGDIKVNALKLKASIVVGSLATDEFAKKLRKGLKGQL